MSDKNLDGQFKARGWSRAIGAGCLAATLCLASMPAALAADVSLKISEFRSYLTDEHPVMRGMKESGRQVSEASKGRVGIEVTGPLLQSPYEIIDLLVKNERMAGGPHLVVVPAIGLAAIEPAFELLNLPYLVHYYEHAEEVLSGPLGRELLARLEKRGLVGLAWFENGFQQLYSAAKPLRKPDDFSGLVLRLMPDAGYAAGFEALGAKVVNAPFSEVAAMLQRGEIDALDSYGSQFYASKIYHPGGYLNETSHSYSGMIVVMNRAEWDSLDAETQAVLRAELPKAAAFQREVNRKGTEEALAAMAADGVHLVDDVDRKAMAAALKANVAKILEGQDRAMLQLLVDVGYLDALPEAQ